MNDLKKFEQKQIAHAVVTAIIAEANRRAAVKELYSHPNSLATDRSHPLGDLLFKRSRNKVYYGGRGGAKSTAMADAAVIRAATGRELILCAREYQVSIADSVHRLIKGSIERLGLQSLFVVTDNSIYCPTTGSEFIFKGLKTNIDGVKSTEGITICWAEEAHKISEESWDILLPTIRADNSELWISMNPDEESDPTYQMFVVNPPPRAIVHLVNFDSNPHFPQVLEDERQELLRKINEAPNDTERARLQDKYNNIWLGMPKKQGDALIFKGKFIIEAFSDDLWKKAPRLFFGADFGFANDPTALTRSFILNNRLHIEYEAGGVGVEIDEHEQLYDSIEGSRKWPIKADNARPETISFLKRKGFNIVAADKWKGSVEDGIEHIRGFDVVVIHPRCKETAKEFGSYSYKKDSRTGQVLPIIVDANNHYIDSIRYALDDYIKRGDPSALWKKLAS